MKTLSARPARGLFLSSGLLLFGLLLVVGVFGGAGVPLAEAGAGRWTPLGPGTGGVGQVVVSPAEPGTLYALAGYPQWEPEVYRSTDGGQTWTWASRGLSRWIETIAVDPDRPGTLYAVTLTGFYRSTDSARTWQLVVQGAPPAGAEQLVLVPGDPVTLYGVSRGGVDKSTDGGLTWAEILPPSDSTSLPHFGLVVDPADPETLYLGIAESVIDRRLWKSTDGGETWSRLEGIPSARPHADIYPLAAAPTSPTTIYATNSEHVYRSRDGGVTWERTGLSHPESTYLTLVVDPVTPTTLYAYVPESAGSGLLVSTDAGMTWTEGYRRGSGGVRLRPAGVDPVTHTLYALGEGGVVLRWPEGAQQWARGSGRVLFTTRVDWVKIHPAAPSTIFAKLRAAGSDPGRFVRSTNGGQGWPLFATNLGDPVVLALGFHPTDPNRLYASTPDEYPFSHVIETGDGGVTWTPLGRVGTYVRTLAATRDGAVLAGGCGVFRSAGAQSWTETLPCVIAPDPSDPDYSIVRTVLELQVHPKSPDTVFALTQEASEGYPGYYSPFPRVVGSRDGGRTWQPLLAGSSVLAIDPSSTQVLYGARNNRIVKSADGGRTWRKLASTGIQQDVLDLVVDPFRPSTLYAAAGKQGVLRSRDGGVTWAPVNTGLLEMNRGNVIGVEAHPTVRGLFYVVPERGGIFEATFQ